MAFLPGVRGAEAMWSGRKPSILVFDVNETLIDIEPLTALFERVVGDESAMREWFGTA